MAKVFAIYFQKPFLGWGAATFLSSINHMEVVGMRNAHNLPLQISYSYGILVGLSLTLFVTFLLVKAYKKIIIKNNLLEKSWLMAVLIAVVFHLSDIVYYDGKISLLIWCLLAGLKCTVEEYDLYIFRLIIHRSLNYV